MSFIQKAETRIKSLISYYFSEAYGHDNYLLYDSFNTNAKDANIYRISTQIKTLDKAEILAAMGFPTNWTPL